MNKDSNRNDFHSMVINRVEDILKTGNQGHVKLYHILRLLAKYRAHLILNTLVKQFGYIVQNGPFKGMQLYHQVSEGCFVPKLLGCYEQELHPVIDKIAQTNYKNVINIGCAEGYYAIGLARLLAKNTTIYAYDIDPNARRICAEVAKKNQVEERLVIKGEFRTKDFANFSPKESRANSLIICDIEGAELELLNPLKVPAQKNIDILVELHDVFNKEISSTIIKRFKETHDIEFIEAGNRDIQQYPCLKQFEHLDQLLAFWEWRAGPTPWAYMRVK